MLQQLIAVLRNTFFESIRQPVMLVVLTAALLLIILANPLSAFTMEDDQRMLIHMGLATIFTGGALLASFIATSVLTREIENRTALTVVSKPVSRPLFILGKFLGVGGAMTVGTLLMSFTFLLVEQHTVLQTVRDPVHLPVITFGLIAAIGGLGAGIWCNYFYGMSFAATTICVLTPLAGLAWVFSMMFRPDFTPQPMSLSFKPDLWLALLCLLMAILVLTAIAIAASTRLGQVMTLAATVGVFLAGMLSDHFLGAEVIGDLRQRWTERAAAAGETELRTEVRTIELTNGLVNTFEEEVAVPSRPLTSYATTPELVGWSAAWAGYAIVPNFQRLWLADAITQKHVVPRSYVARALLYGALYIVVALSAAVVLFQRREVG